MYQGLTVLFLTLIINLKNLMSFYHGLAYTRLTLNLGVKIYLLIILKRFRVVHCLQLKGLALSFGGTCSCPHSLIIIIDFKLIYFLIVSIIITLLFCICRGLLAYARVSFNSPVKTKSEVWIWGEYSINPSSIYSLPTRYVTSIIPMGLEQIVL